METNKILKADILDILFEGKNKAYGAYDLRKTYNSRMLKALLITGVFLLFVFIGSVIANKIAEPHEKQTIDVIDTEMAEVEKEKVVPPKPIEPIIPPPAQEINQVKYTAPTIVKDDLVKPDEKIVEITDDAAISSKTVESDIKDHVVQAPVEDKGTQVVEVPKTDDNENKIFNSVEVEAAFPGGQAAWVKYLRNNLNANIANDNAAPAGTYKVIVRFIVSKDGLISDVVAETKLGYGMEDEAVKIIKKGPKWTPALQNGTNVNAYRRQPITFVVADE